MRILQQGSPQRRNLPVLPREWEKLSEQRNAPSPTTPTPTRTITFAPKTQHQRRDRDIAVAWITAQKPGRIFQSPNVTATIHRELRIHGFKVSQNYVKYSMDNLVNEGWAEALVIGKRTTMFALKPDVEVPTPLWVTVNDRVNGAEPAPAPAPTVADVASYYEGDLIASTPRFRSTPPLPRQPVPRTPVVFDDLHSAIMNWWREEPEPAEAWAYQALNSLIGDGRV